MDRRQFVIGSAAAAAAPLVREALAQDAFPSRPVTILNAFPPGGINDLVTRPAASALEAVFKQPVVVETKAGAAGAVGAQVAANAKPDGYTLLSHNNGISGYAEVDKLFGRQPKTTRADFIPLGAAVRRSGAGAGQRPAALQDAGRVRRRRQEAARKRSSTARAASTARAICRSRCWRRRRASRACAICRPRAAGRRSRRRSATTRRLTTQTVQATLQHVKAGKLRALATVRRRSAPRRCPTCRP